VSLFPFWSVGGRMWPRKETTAGNRWIRMLEYLRTGLREPTVPGRQSQLGSNGARDWMIVDKMWIFVFGNGNPGCACRMHIKQPPSHVGCSTGSMVLGFLPLLSPTPEDAEADYYILATNHGQKVWDTMAEQAIPDVYFSGDWRFPLWIVSNAATVATYP
jgi:hypothetical protein